MTQITQGSETMASENVATSNLTVGSQPDTSESEFERFEALAAKLIQVPKIEPKV